MQRTTFIIAALTLLASLGLALAPTAAADATCTPYTGSGMTKSRSCVDPTSSRCVYWMEGWVGSSPFYACWVPAEVPTPIQPST